MSSDTYTYKASGRYVFGWTDPRLDHINMEEVLDKEHFSAEMTVEQLRAAWMLEFGDRVVSQFRLAENSDMYKIGQQLYARGQLYEDRDLSSISLCYRLKRAPDEKEKSS